MAETISSWIVLGRDENGDEIDGPWWPLFHGGPPIRAASSESAIKQVRKRLPIRDVWAAFVAVPLELWRPQ